VPTCLADAKKKQGTFDACNCLDEGVRRLDDQALIDDSLSPTLQHGRQIDSRAACQGNATESEPAPMPALFINLAM
jgi:hypothetical protein